MSNKYMSASLVLSHDSDSTALLCLIFAELTLSVLPYMWLRYSTRDTIVGKETLSPNRIKIGMGRSCLCVAYHCDLVLMYFV